MPEVVKWNGGYSVSRARRSTIIATGISPSTPPTELGVWIGYKTTAGAPTTPDGLHASKYTLAVCSFANGSITTLSLTADATGRVVVQTALGGGDPAAIAQGNYVWVGVTETDDPTETFLALAGPKRAAP